MAEATPLDELRWSSPEWIQAFGLNSFNVLEYFAESPFFDRTSNNQVLKMQFQFNEATVNLSQSHPIFMKNLQKMTGVEFIILINNEPSFYLIRKQERVSPTKTQILNDYYIINSNIYMSPNIYSVVSSRLLNCTLNFKKSFKVFTEINELTSSTPQELQDVQSLAELEAKLDSGVEMKPTSSSQGTLNNTTANTIANTPTNLKLKDTPNSTGITPNTPSNVYSKPGSNKNQQHQVIFDKLLSITTKELRKDEEK